MIQLIRISMAGVTLVAALTGCSTSETESVTPTISVAAIDGSALPSASGVEGSYPVAPGIEQYTPDPTEALVVSGEPDESARVLTESPRCVGFRVTDVVFASGRPDLAPSGTLAIPRIAERIPEEATITITGHTDNIPIAMGNQRLSELRAEAVADALRPLLTPSQRIVSINGVGDSEPIGDNATDQGRQANRRVEVLVNCDT